MHPLTRGLPHAKPDPHCRNIANPLTPTTSRRTENVARIRVPVGEYERLDGEDRVRYLLGMIERVLGAGLKPGIGRFECLLKPLGIAPADDDEIRRDLYELAAIRNAIVHRAKLADSRLLSLCPWLPYKDGDALNVSRDQSRPRD
jgi:hypothetical protein